MAIILLKQYVGVEDNEERWDNAFRYAACFPPMYHFPTYCLMLIGGNMFGLNKKKNEVVVANNNDNRPVKMVQVSENVYKFVWADE